MDPQSLLLFFSLRQPRRIKVIENVLSGRKTVSNLYWGMRYGLLDYLGALKSINKSQDAHSIKDLLTDGKLTTPDSRNYLLTPQGYQEVLQLRKSWYRPRFLKYNLNYNLERLKSRFLLAVQVVSEYSYQNRTYYPIQIGYLDAELVKRWFHFSKDHDLTKRCYQFLAKFFKALDRLNPTLGWQAVNLLIGHDNPGQTLTQQSRQLHQPVTELLFRQVDVLGALVAMVLKNPQPFASLLTGLKRSPVSINALKTYQLARNHYNFRQICKIQHIRISTVKEHLLGTAIFYPDRFPFSAFISTRLMKLFSQIYRGNPDKWSFPKYQAVTGHPVDFFYFRLYQILRSHQND